MTGASSGIGQACAVRLSRHGWRVLAGVRREGDAPAGSEELLLDVTDPPAALEVDRLHGLVNNAGIAVAGPLEFLDADELRRQLEVNVVGQLRVTQLAVPALREARGRIVNIGSISGRSALPFLGAYAMSKFALEAMTDSLRVELRPWGIHVAIVEPGTIK
ncbi:MAG TPA: SDR family NAD(P)-dependent oxidoreductase, partial [Gaiellaceae bacterium]